MVNLSHQLMLYLSIKSYLGYVGPQSTSQQFLMMFLWLYGFWSLFFPDQEPLIWSKPKRQQLNLQNHKSKSKLRPALATDSLSSLFPELI